MRLQFSKHPTEQFSKLAPKVCLPYVSILRGFGCSECSYSCNSLVSEKAVRLMVPTSHPLSMKEHNLLVSECRILQETCRY